MTPARTVAGLAAVLAASAVLLGPGAGHAAAAPQDGVARLEVRDLVGVVDGRVRVEATVRAPAGAGLEGAALRLTAYQRTRSRFGLDAALDEGARGAAIGAATIEAPSVAAGQAAPVSMAPEASELGLADAVPGVYPVTVELVGADSAQEPATSAVVLAAAVEQPLSLAIVLRTGAPLTRDDSGRRDEQRAVRGARALRRTAGVADALGVPTTLAVDAQRLEDLAAEDAGAVTALATAGAEDTGYAAQPYAGADLVALRRAGRLDELARLVVAGRERTERTLGGAVAGSVVTPAAPIDGATARVLADAGIDGALLAEEDLGLDADRELPRTPGAVRPLAGAGGLVAVVPDRFLSDRLATSGREPAGLAAQRLIAEAAAVYFERPAIEARGLVVEATPAIGEDLAAALGQRIAAVPWLRPVPVVELVEGVRPGEAVTPAYPTEARRAELAEAHIERVLDARSNLAVLDGVVARGRARTDSLRRDLDLALGVDLRGAAHADLREALVRRASDAVASLAGAVSIPTGPPITLTGIEGVVPVTLSNAADEALTVDVRLSTTRYDVEDPAGREVELPAETVVTETFAVVSRAPGGTYPIGVEVVDPEGRMQLAEAQVVVRSTAVSVGALVVTVSAGVLLVAWVAIDLLRGGARRRGAPR